MRAKVGGTGRCLSKVFDLEMKLGSPIACASNGDGVSVGVSKCQEKWMGTSSRGQYERYGFEEEKGAALIHY